MAKKSTMFALSLMFFFGSTTTLMSLTLGFSGNCQEHNSHVKGTQRKKGLMSFPQIARTYFVGRDTHS